MNRDDFDIDLERRLRSIGRSAPEAPASLDEAAREVTLRPRSGSARSFELGDRRRGMRWLGAIAAALAVVVVVGSVLRMAPANRNTAGWTPRPDPGNGQWTAIEWHDVSSNFAGMFSSITYWPGYANGRPITWPGGYALMDEQGRWWLSTDGLDWRRATTVPNLAGVIPVGDSLLVVDSFADRPSMWLSTDGTAKDRLDPPFDVGMVYGITHQPVGTIAAVVVDQAARTRMPIGPFDLYFSTDERSWTRVSLPNDMAIARNLSVVRLQARFVASGEVPDPNGNLSDTDAAGNTETFSEHFWISDDGVHWSTFAPADPPTYTGFRPWMSGTWGRLGAASQGIFHSLDGGQTWLLDDWAKAAQARTQPTDSCMEIPLQVVADGSRLVMSTSSGACFYVSEGDGNWTPLRQGGDIGHLPTDGVMLIEPRGLLWIAGTRVYFGEALSGIEPEGTIGAPISPTPDPNATPSNTPAPAIPASSPTPAPPTRP